jgi:hypothetical protein
MTNRIKNNCIFFLFKQGLRIKSWFLPIGMQWSINKKHHGRIGFRILIAWDSDGCVVATRTAHYPNHYIGHPYMAEAWATLHTVLFSKKIELYHIIPEGDALQVVNEINSDNLSMHEQIHTFHRAHRTIT